MAGGLPFQAINLLIPSEIPIRRDWTVAVEARSDRKVSIMSTNNAPNANIMPKSNMVTKQTMINTNHVSLSTFFLL